jgi:DNA-binding NarL/FixJ family response regulator
LILLKEKLPSCKVIIFTATVNPQTVRVALQGNADAFVEKGDGLDGLKHALEAAKIGKRYFSPHIKKMMAGYEEDLGSKYPFR